MPLIDGRFTNGLLHSFANDVERAFKLPLVKMIPGDEHLANDGFGLPGLRADRLAVHRHGPPAETPQPFLGDDALKEALA